LIYIDEELEEQETEEKVVMKKVLEKRKKVMEEEEEFFRQKLALEKELKDLNFESINKEAEENAFTNDEEDEGIIF
jgi:hypothetical protein